MSETRRGYPSDVTDDEWAFVAPYLTLMREDAPQWDYPLRNLLDALRWVVKTGCQWRYLPGDFPPWHAVYQQARRWLAAGCFEAAAHDLRELLRLVVGRDPRPSAVVLDGRTIQSTPTSGARIDPDQRGAGRVRRAQAAEGVEGPHGGGHPRASAGPAGDPGERR